MQRAYFDFNEDVFSYFNTTFFVFRFVILMRMYFLCLLIMRLIMEWLDPFSNNAVKFSNLEISLVAAFWSVNIWVDQNEVGYNNKGVTIQKARVSVFFNCMKRTFLIWCRVSADMNIHPHMSVKQTGLFLPHGFSPHSSPITFPTRETRNQSLLPAWGPGDGGERRGDQSSPKECKYGL